MLSTNQVRKAVFEATRARYFAENDFARAYVRHVFGKEPEALSADQLPSDHTAIRLNSYQSYLNLLPFLYALGMEVFEDAESKGFRDKSNQALAANDPSVLEGIIFPYEFASKGLHSTHADVAGDIAAKGSGEKLFISMVNRANFPAEIQKHIAEDQALFANDFSLEGKQIIAKLQADKQLPHNEVTLLIEEWLHVFSQRIKPMKATTFDAICHCQMVVDGKPQDQSLPAIAAIGMAMSGVRNHHTLRVGYDIETLPPILESIGVPPGSPPVQFSGGIVQTSSLGIKQDVRLQKGEGVETRSINHEYVEYIHRAQFAQIEESEYPIPVWQRTDGSYVSALQTDRSDPTHPSFASYDKPVTVIALINDTAGNPSLVPGFKADNANNIFLGTRV